MVNDDTIKLLRECDAGVKMGISSINDVLCEVENKSLGNILRSGRDKHEKLDHRIQAILQDYQDEGKEPNVMAKGMSWMKTSMKMAMDHTDATVANLMTDGCNMGVKSLSKYMNQYTAAETKVKDLARELIEIEEQMAEDMKAYL